MRLATIIDWGQPTAAVIGDSGCLPLAVPGGGLDSVRGIAALGADGLARVQAWVEGQPDKAYRSLADTHFAPAVADPGAIYTVGGNYRAPSEPAGDPPDRPLIFGKAGASVAGHGATLTWDRTLTANVDAECELGVVIGADGGVFGYTIINDVSSRDPWLDGDQWLLGKSMPGFCPVGPWIVTADELDITDQRLGCTLDGVAIQDGRTSEMRTSIAGIVAYLGRHVTLRPGDLIATGTPVRLAGPLGPERHLEPGDTVTAWIEGIGELTTIIA